MYHRRLAVINFALHYRLLRGRAITVFKDTEFRVYTGIVLVATLLLTLGTWQPVIALLPQAEYLSFDGYVSFMEALRYGVFQALAIITTTGFATADYEIWPSVAKPVVVIIASA